MELIARVSSFANTTYEKFATLVTPSNAVSLSRPLIAWYGLNNFKDDPIYLSLTLGAAFATDALDGVVARYLKQESDIGRLVDLAGDRALEMLTLFSFAEDGTIPYSVPLSFMIKDAIVDPLRLRMYRDKTQLSTVERAQKAVYSTIKGVYICAIPLFGDFVDLDAIIAAHSLTIFTVARKLKS